MSIALLLFSGITNPGNWLVNPEYTGPQPAYTTEFSQQGQEFLDNGWQQVEGTTDDNENAVIGDKTYETVAFTVTDEGVMLNIYANDVLSIKAEGDQGERFYVRTLN